MAWKLKRGLAGSGAPETRRRSCIEIVPLAKPGSLPLAGEE